MDRRKRTKEEETKKTKQKNNNGESDIFASCSFSSLGLHPALCDQLRERMGFEVPTTVQGEAIPVILSGRHVLVNAATGTGKTVAYLAPIIHHLHQYDPRIERSAGTFALVLVPTRELCMQVYEILHKLLHRFHWIVPGYVMGGENRSKEKARLRKGRKLLNIRMYIFKVLYSYLEMLASKLLVIEVLDTTVCQFWEFKAFKVDTPFSGISILVATPGRLLDHLKNTSSFLHTNLRWIIFDEADRILELGFGKEIEEILDLLGSRTNGSTCREHPVMKISEFQRQNLLLSATLNEKVNHLAQISLENPVTIGLGDKKMQPNPPLEHSLSVKSHAGDDSEKLDKIISPSNRDYKLPALLVQRYVKVPCGSRLVVLLSILKHLFEREASQKIVVFFSTCDAVDFHYSLFSTFLCPPHSHSETEDRQMFLRFKTFQLHGNMKHEDRRTAFQTFKKDKSALLLSTDVAARGLDFPKVRCIIQYDSPGEASEYVHRGGRTARLGERGDSLLFLQPVEMDYLHDLEKHGVSLTEYPLLKVLDSFPLFGQKHHIKKFISLEMHPWVLYLQKALESFILAEPKTKKLAKDAFCSWVRAYTAHRGELKGIFQVKKLHLGHVAKSFALKDQPSLVGKSLQMQIKKRKRDQKQQGPSRRKKLPRKS